MKVYIRKCENNEFPNVNYYIAYDGFRQLGAEIVFFTNIRNIADNKPEDVIVGGIGEVRYILDKLDKAYPTLEYPESIAKSKYLGRRIWKDTLGTIMSNELKMGIFIKPVAGGKLFPGKVVKELKDFRVCAGLMSGTEVWCSELVNFVSEYRCFIRYGEVIGVKHYSGDVFTPPSRDVLLSIIQDYNDAPNAYSIDLGVTDKGETLLVEINEGYSIGSYGLDSITYAKFLATRWAQLTGTQDAYDW